MSSALDIFGQFLLGGVVGVLGIQQFNNQSQAAKSANSALDLQSKQNAIAYNQKSIDTYQKLTRLLSKQQAIQSVSGFSAASPSFMAIQADTFNKGYQEQKNLDVNRSIFESNIANERENIANRLRAQLLQNAVSYISTGVSLAAL